MKKKRVAMMCAAVGMAAVMMAGCGAKETGNQKTSSAKGEVSSSAEAEGKDEENYETGDASLDNTRNQDEIGDKELLVVSLVQATMTAVV